MAVRGVCLGVLYALAYLWLRGHSMDQWYLPAGLRVAALLVVPRRYWLALFAGEVCVIFGSKIPVLHRYGLAWWLINPFDAFPPAALIVHIARSRSQLPRVASSKDMAWFIAMALACAIATTASSSIVNGLLMGGQKLHFDAEQILIYVLGDFLGIVMVVSSVLLMFSKNGLGYTSNNYTFRSALVAGLAYALYALGFSFNLHIDSGLYHALQLVILWPTAWLTLRHGWRGALLGAAMTNLCVGLTLRGNHVVAAIDHGLLVVEVALAFMAVALIGFGSKITHQNELAQRRKQQALQARHETHAAMELARSGFTYSEQALREMRDSLAATQARSRKPRLVGKETAVDAPWLLDAIYPLDLDEYGLFAALGSSSFHSALSEAGIEYRPSLKGDSRALSEASRQTLYRLAYDAVHHLAECKPEEIHLSLRIGGRETSKALLVARAHGSYAAEDLPSPRLLSLQARACAFGVQLRVQPRSVVLSLNESIGKGIEPPRVLASFSFEELTPRHG